MAAITAATVGTIAVAGSIYGANKQAGAAKEAANTQAKGVAAAQDASYQATQAALPEIKSGFEGAREQIQIGAGSASRDLALGEQNSESTLSGSYQGARDDLTNAYGQARGDISSGYSQANQQLQSGYGAAGNQLSDAYGQAQSTLAPTSQQGAGASQLQSALSGALGPEAQAQAFASYQESPGQKFLQSQQEQSLLRNQAAMGGGLSNSPGVQAELQALAAGNAAQNYNTNFSQLGTIAQRGDAATQGISALQASLGNSRAGIQTQLAGLLGGNLVNQGSNLANLGSQYGSNLSGLQSQYGTNMSNLQGQNALNRANLNQTTAGLLAQSLQGQGTTTANTLIGQGSEQAQLAQNYGQAKSGGAIYNAQNAPALVQGINTGLGLYEASGGDFSNPFSGLFGGKSSQDLGASQAGYSSKYFP